MGMFIIFIGMTISLVYVDIKIKLYLIYFISILLQKSWGGGRGIGRNQPNPIYGLGLKVSTENHLVVLSLVGI